MLRVLDPTTDVHCQCSPKMTVFRVTCSRLPIRLPCSSYRKAPKARQHRAWLPPPFDRSNTHMAVPQLFSAKQTHPSLYLITHSIPSFHAHQHPSAQPGIRPKDSTSRLPRFSRTSLSGQNFHCHRNGPLLDHRDHLQHLHRHPHRAIRPAPPRLESDRRWQQVLPWEAEAQAEAFYEGEEVQSEGLSVWTSIGWGWVECGDCCCRGDEGG